VSGIESETGRERLREIRVAPVNSPTVTKDFRMRKLINRFHRDEEGAALVEYGMLVGLIAVICVAAVTLLGQEVSDGFSVIAAALSAI
jgi:pilus assembly protein Flp/PilA